MFIIRHLRRHHRDVIPPISSATRSISTAAAQRELDFLTKIEEEKLPDYDARQFYPVRIGEIFRSSRSAYEVVGKLGYGRNSTVWLCRNSMDRSFYTVKVGTTNTKRENQEARIYDHLSKIQSSHSHIGQKNIRMLLEAFEIEGPHGKHHCLVHTPLGMNLSEFQDSFEFNEFPEDLVKGLLIRLLQALDFLHTQASVIHTDIRARNVQISLADDEPIRKFVNAERDEPCARKVIDEHRTIYTSRALDFSSGYPILCDFGLAVLGKEHERLIQPLPFRAPEVILRMKWDSKVDIWNLGVLTWVLLFNQHLFSGTTEQEQLAHMVGGLGLPPRDFLGRSEISGDYFDEHGNWKASTVTPSLIEEKIEGEGVNYFLDFIKSMVAWVPEERKTAAELLEHPWLYTDEEDE